MLAAANRLRRRAEFAAAIRAGRRAGRGALVVHVASSPVASVLPPTGTAAPAEQPTGARPAAAASVARTGFVVSKAVGGAVVRNQVRRRLRHLMRERLSALPVGADVVVRATPAAAGRGYAQLGVDLDAALGAAAEPGRRSARSGRTAGTTRRGQPR